MKRVTCYDLKEIEVQVMTNFVVSKCMKLIKNNKPELNETELEIIQYGLHGLYLSLTKIIVLIIISYFLGQLKEYIIFSLLFGILRMNSFGMHAKKSWMCWVTTIPMLIILPFLAKNIAINNIIKAILGIPLILHIFKYSPADTHKKPIINKDIRRKYKIKATIVATTYVIASLFINNVFISNSLILSLILISILISPITYKIFNLPYNNYLKYTSKETGRKEKLC